MEDKNWHENFVAKHEGEFGAAQVGSWLYFYDGAKMEASSHGARFLPSDDAKQLHRDQVCYWQVIVANLAKQFSAKKTELASASKAGINVPSKQDVKDLEALRQKVLKAQGVLDELAEGEEAELEREIDRARQIYTQQQNLQKEIKRRREISERSDKRGTMGEYRKQGKLLDQLKVQFNQLNAEWRQCSGEARHIVVLEERQKQAERMNVKLDAISI